MRVLRQGARGGEVRRWQVFLIGQGFDPGEADGKFGLRTAEATQAFQSRHGLVADGVLGNRTLGQAMLLGFGVVVDPSDARDGPNFPPPPPFPPLRGTRARQELFGKFAFEHAPGPGNAERIRVLDHWTTENLVAVRVAALRKLPGGPGDGKILFHRLAADQLVALWDEWADRRLLDRLITWDGGYVPRFIRGSTSVLSNHAFATAFDVNAVTNPLGAIPALMGRQGCVRELVQIANAHGFYWGGHFGSRPDGMHFELARVF